MSRTAGCNTVMSLPPPAPSPSFGLEKHKHLTVTLLEYRVLHHVICLPSVSRQSVMNAILCETNWITINTGHVSSAPPLPIGSPTFLRNHLPAQPSLTHLPTPISSTQSISTSIDFQHGIPFHHALPRTRLARLPRRRGSERYLASRSGQGVVQEDSPRRPPNEMF